MSNFVSFSAQKSSLCNLRANSPSIENVSSVIQLISNSCTIDLHTCCEHNQVVPLRHNVEEKVDVRSLVNEKSDGMTIDDN